MRNDVTFVTSPPLACFSLRSDDAIRKNGGLDAVGEGSLGRLIDEGRMS